MILFLQKKMNSRLFLYSAFFFVTILLYDAYSIQDQGDTPQNEVLEESYKSPPSTNNVVDDKRSIQLKSDEADTTTSSRNVPEVIDIESNNLKVKISLDDGSIVRAELRKFKKSFGAYRCY